MTLNAVFLKDGKVQWMFMSLKMGGKKAAAQKTEQNNWTKDATCACFWVGGLPGNLIRRLRWFMDSTESQ